MKCIFLDLDGVLNKGGGPLLPELVRNLNYLTDRTGAKIVVHSSWRFHRPAEAIVKTLKAAGIKADILGMAPTPPTVTDTQTYLTSFDSEGTFAFVAKAMPYGWVTEPSQAWQYERAAAIQTWLNEHPGECSSFVILDDYPKMGHLKSRHIRTKENEGLTSTQAEQALFLLGPGPA